jgi:lipopolysaccharide/colanic/teichoic acid biosynthesis glycosyltransferase
MASGGRSRAQERDRVLLVDAAPDELMLLHRDLEGDAERPATVAATLSLDEARSTGSSSPLIDAVIAEGATVVVLSGAARLDESVVSQAATLHEGGVRIRTISLFYEEWMGKLPVAELERVSLMFDIGEVHRRRYARASRLVDLPIALAGVLTLVIATPFVLLGDLFANRGPLLYRQPRVGKDGKEFRILKFRTMRAERGESPNEWTRRDDPRITPFGQFMRTTHVDELPQFINILRGDLALVGPRPEQPHYVAELREKLPFYDLRHLVHPGLTGWAQVKYGYAGDERDALEKLQYEFFYLRHQSLMFDLRIMGRTVRSVLGRSGR